MPVAEFSVRRFLWFVYILPYFALFSCVGLSLLKDFERSTGTHCNVYNFLPSISGMIADFIPQRYIWHLCFALYSFPRYIIGYLQMKSRMSRHHINLPELYKVAQFINEFIHLVELTCILLLTYISSSEIHWIHAWSSAGAIICSLLHMLFTILIDYRWPLTFGARLSGKEKRLRAKRLRWFAINISSCSIATYFYVRHNSYCEPNIYSMFCLFEYIAVLTNIAYHAVVMDEWDRQGKIQIYY